MAITAFKLIHGFDVSPHGQRLSGAVVRGEGDPGEAHGALPLDGRYSSSNRKVTSAGPGTSNSTCWSSSLTQGWVRWKIKLLSLPTDGDAKIALFGARGYSLSADVINLTVDSTGKLEAWSYSGSSTPTSLGSSGATVLSVGQWYTIHVFTRFNQISSQPAPNPPYQSDGRVEVFLDGTNVISYNPGGGDVSFRYGVNAWAVTTYMTFTVGLHLAVNAYYSGFTTATDCYGYMDSLAAYEVDSYDADDAVLGHVLAVTPSNVNASSTGWGITSSNDALACQDHPCDGSTDNYSSSTANDEAIFDFPSWTSLGVGGEIRHIDVILMAGPSFAGSLVLYVNDVETEVISGLSYPVNQYLSARFTTTLDPSTDVIKVGVRKDNNTTLRYFIRVLVEIECSEFTAPAVSDVVKVAYGSYTGNGTQTTIDCGFKPSWVWAFPVVSGGKGLIKSRTTTGYPTYVWGMLNGNGTYGVYMPKFTSTGFVVRGTSADVNANTVDYVYIAVRDESQRVMKYGSTRMWTGLDDENIALDVTGEYTGFTPELAVTQSCSRTISILNCWIRGPGHTGDQANDWQAGTSGWASANYIQSLGADVIQIGSGQNATNTEWVTFFGIRDTAFSTTNLWQVFTYDGDGGASKNVSLPAALSAITPTFVLVQAAEDPGSNLPGYYRVSGSDAGYSKRMGDGSYVSTGITAFGTGQFTVDSALNTSGITYNVWVITTGTDTPSTPTDAEFPPTPGSIPPWDVDWPDDTPGLLGVKFSIIAYDPGAVPLDPWAYPVQCEQRQFPVDTQDFEINAPCEQRQFDALLGDEQRE